MEFVRDSFRKSYQHSPRTARWPQAAYAAWVPTHLDAFLARSSIVVARPLDWDAGILGWIAAEQKPARFVLHYAFVRTLFRKQGVMTALIKSLAPHGELVFSHLRPPYTNGLRANGFTWDPRESSTNEGKHGRQ